MSFVSFLLSILLTVGLVAIAHGVKEDETAVLAGGIFAVSMWHSFAIKR